MPLFQITLFYPNLKGHASTVQEMRREIELTSGNRYRVLSAGEQVCAIGFATDESLELLRARFRPYGSEHFHFLLVQVAEAVQGYLTKGTWE